MTNGLAPPGAGGVDLWLALAMAGSKVTAEALDAEDLRRMHVAGPLDTYLADWVASGSSVVLTGNAGDGKTHALRIAAAHLEEAGAIVVWDATALMRRGDPTPVLDRWREADDRGVPFCLAINEYPLYQLRRAAPDFPPLSETWRQCRNRQVYGESGSKEANTDLVVVDLSLRNPLAPDFVMSVLDAILNDAAFAAAVAADPRGSPAANAAKLRDGSVRERLRETLSRAVRLGARTTVRDVWILAARMVMGTPGGANHSRADWYFEPLFGHGALTSSEALARSIDPAACSHPTWDARLEASSAELDGGWRLGRPPVPPQPRLDRAVFAWLKRAFYFEHDEGLEAIELADPEAAEFRDLLGGAASGVQSVVPVVDAINAAYCPARFSGREHHLYLWTGHRFHEQPSRSFIATERIGVDDLRLEAPRLPARITGAFEFMGDHLMLVAAGWNGARLRIDYPLYRTLRRLGRGLPRKLVPEREIHRLDAFLEQLGAARHGGGETVWSVHLEHMEVLRVGLSPDGRRYETVRADV